jgi:hypothetical protein
MGCPMTKPTGPMRLPKPTTSDRRACIRRLADLQMGWQPFTGAEALTLPATVRDISTDGIGFRADSKVECKTITVRLQNADGTFMVSKLVRVKHLRVEDAKQIFGGCFVKKLTVDELRWLLENQA